MTPPWDQAVSWARRFKQQGRTAFISEYTLDDEALTLPRTLHFEDYSDEWLDFIMACRNGKKVTDWDIIMGGVANDRVFDTVQLFFAGLIDREKAIERLRFHEPNYQICLRTQEMIDQYLRYTGSRKI